MAVVTDPVCGEQFDSAGAVAQSQYQGKTYYFSATECKDRFEEDPARYANDPAGDQGRVNHAMGDRNTSIAATTPDTVVGGPNYGNDQMQDRMSGRKPETKRSTLGDIPFGGQADDEQPRH
jgi:YHS domain-containing protein